MGTLNLKHLKQYRDLAWLMLKHGRGDLVRRAGLDALDGQNDAAEASGGGGANTLASDLERLGPTYVKLGQGNVFLTDTDNIALIDLGMVALVPPGVRDAFLKLILAVSEGRGDKAAQIAVALGAKRDDYDERQFFRRIGDLVAETKDLPIQQANVGRSTLEIKRIAAECGVSLPPEVTMVGKALLQLDEIARKLAPDFDPNASIRNNAMGIMQHKFRASLSPGRLFTSVLEAKGMLEEMPARLNTILDRLANNDVRIKVDALDETTLIEGMQKIANRITTGLVLAALIVGAAMLMNVPTSFRLWGYPGLALIFFSLAAGGGIVLVASILANDFRAGRPGAKRPARLR